MHGIRQQMARGAAWMLALRVIEFRRQRHGGEARPPIADGGGGVCREVYSPHVRLERAAEA